MGRHPEPLFPQAVLDALGQAPGSPAFEHGPRTVTRGELLDLIGRLSLALRAAGLGPGQGMAIRTRVTPEAFAAHLAAHVVGCRVVGIRPGYPPAQLAHVLGTGVAAIVVDPETATPELRRAAGPIPLLSLGPCAGPADLVAEPVDLLAEPGGAGVPVVTARPDDVAALHFTSGSTGRPKGCAITYAALGAHWAWQPRRWGPAATAFAAAFQRYLLFGTLASMVVLEFLAPCLLGGGTAVIPDDEGTDDRPMFPYAIERHRITGSIITVPRLYRMLHLLREDPGVDLGSLRALMVSGSPISPSRLAAATELLGPVVYQGYGQTEAGSITMLTPADLRRDPERALASVGRPHPGVELSVRDDEGEPLPTGAAGEIHVRSPYLMAGYWGADEESPLRDGWLRTRDLGHLDEQGFLHLSGRSRDVIMVNAMVVYAGPIERALVRHPDVEEAYVAGAPDERRGEAVHAFVVPAAGRVPDRAALAELVRDELGDDSVPSTFTVVPAVPVAEGGKPDKRALLDLL
ncbi:AMP-binding protein [Nonomuraea sp. NN258]|uniref:class I adenylate-forming enzyme family protein n=1 Tax=Nonomuraea antri TaxID=2730852 RepID=UPI001568DE3B|nr:AMP-binding protein [Nonomuraea antri]NRQ31179.1 AMP-binding protein [Nonomuraea antri]